MTRIIILILIVIIGITAYFILKPKKEIYELKSKVKGTENTFYVPVKSKKGKWGYQNINGNWVIQPKFDDAWEYHNGLASASVHNKYGLINTNGEWVVAPEYDAISSDNNGYYIASVEENEYVIDEKGKVWIKAKTNDISWNLFSEGLLMVNDYSKGLFGFKDVNNNWIIKPGYMFSADFSEGLASVSIDGKKRLFINKKGETVLSLADEIDYAGSFNGGLAPARVNKKYGYINTKGAFVIQPQFDGASEFSEGYAPVFIGEKCVFINNRAEIQTNLKTYEDALKFDNGYALVRENGKAGYIDKTGGVVIPIRYDVVFYLNKGFCRVLLNKKEFYVDTNGKAFVDN